MRIHKQEPTVSQMRCAACKNGK